MRSCAPATVNRRRGLTGEADLFAGRARLPPSSACCSSVANSSPVSPGRRLWHGLPARRCPE